MAVLGFKLVYYNTWVTSCTEYAFWSWANFLACTMARSFLKKFFPENAKNLTFCEGFRLCITSLFPLAFIYLFLTVLFRFCYLALIIFKLSWFSSMYWPTVAFHFYTVKACHNPQNEAASIYNCLNTCHSLLQQFMVCTSGFFWPYSKRFWGIYNLYGVPVTSCNTVKLLR